MFLQRRRLHAPPAPVAEDANLVRPKSGIVERTDTDHESLFMTMVLVDTVGLVVATALGWPFGRWPELMAWASIIALAVAWYWPHRFARITAESQWWNWCAGAIGLMAALVALIDLRNDRTPDAAAALFYAICIPGILLYLGLRGVRQRRRLEPDR